MQVTAKTISFERHGENLPMRPPCDDVASSCDQFIKEHEAPSRVKYFPQFVSLVLGHTLTRRVSNLLSCAGLPTFYAAQRDYPVLPPTAERLQLAKKYVPILSTISESQAKCAQTNRSELCYELLPPDRERNCYTLIYYLGFPTERVPVGLLDRLYEWVRPVLYGSKKDWEAIQVDLDPNSMEPISVCFETSNYFNEQSSYDTLRAEDLHLKCRITKTEDGSWRKVVTQQNGRTCESKVANPFVSGGTHPCFTIVAWNGSLDLSSEIAKQSELKTYRINTTEVQFLDLESFRKEGIDLRVGWLKERKFGKFLLSAHARKGLNA